MIYGKDPQGRFFWCVGIENTWMAQRHRKNERVLDEYELTQHYQFWKEDIDLVADLGANSIRWSVPWYKANPSPGKYEWSWSDRVIDYMIRKGIDPIIDLIHYGTPLWMANELLNQSYPERIAEYASEFAKHYRGTVLHYTPHNEPLVNIRFCGEIGIWPPYLHGSDGYAKIAKNVCKGIVLTVQAIRDAQPESTMVYVDCGRILQREDETVEEARLRIAKDLICYDLTSGMIDGSHVLYDFLLGNGFSQDELDWFQENAVELDIVGVNYYPDIVLRQIASSMFIKDKMVLTDEIMRKGAEMLRDTVKAYYERYKRPIFITETSAGYDDQEKIDWLRRSIEVIHGLQNSDVPVVGYDWWPLFDAVQWTYRFDNAPVEEHMRLGGWNNGIYTMRKGFDGVFKRVGTRLAEEYRNTIKKGLP